MKKITFPILSILLFINAFAQHEDIERHFTSSKISIVETEDDTYVKDTLTDDFHMYLPQQKLAYNNLGFMNPGQPHIAAIYSKQAGGHPFWFLNNYSTFIQTHDNIVYFDASKPFTLFTFDGGASEQELVSFLHTQNIGSTFNFAFKYDIINSTGHYQENKAKVNAISLATAYTKRRYQSHFNFIYNKVNHFENGGIANGDLYDTLVIPASKYATNLSGVQNTISQLGIQYNHEYRFGSYTEDTIVLDVDTAINKMFKSNFSIIHDVQLDRYYRIYQDNPSSLPDGFYLNTFIDTLPTFDSTSYKTIDNKFLLNFNLDGNKGIKNFQVLAGIKNFFYNYATDSLSSQSYLSNYVTGMINLETKVGTLNGEINYCFLGTDIFDMDASVNYNQRFSDNSGFEAYFNYAFQNPSIFYYNYKSNHFEWEIEPSKILTNAAGIDFYFNQINLNVGSNINLIKNYIVYDTLAMPTQINTANLIGDAYVSKRFDFGNFHWFAQFTYQYISDKENLPLPEFIGYSNFYFKKPIFQNALVLQLGFDVKYHSSIYGYAYNPALGAFYVQDKKTMGNYPNAGVYAAVRVKRVRGYVKASNINSTFMPGPYYILYQIPDNPLSINFGISWEFYD